MNMTLYLKYKSTFCTRHQSDQLGLLHHLFADDVQAYINTEAQVAETVLALTSLMTSNRLLLDPPKTHFIWLVGHRQLPKIDFPWLSSLFHHLTLFSFI